jgi:hypothetical protein
LGAKKDTLSAGDVALFHKRLAKLPEDKVVLWHAIQALPNRKANKNLHKRAFIAQANEAPRQGGRGRGGGGGGEG